MTSGGCAATAGSRLNERDGKEENRCLLGAVQHQAIGAQPHNCCPESAYCDVAAERVGLGQIRYTALFLSRISSAK